LKSIRKINKGRVSTFFVCSILVEALYLLTNGSLTNIITLTNLRSGTMIFEKVKDIIAEELGIEQDSIKLESNLTDDLGADSLDAIELIMAVEEQFDVEIADSEATNIKLVSDIVTYLENAGK